MNKPYVHSNYERIKDDDYKTIDPRCVQALMKTYPVWGYVIDCCAPTGSGIVDNLLEYGVRAVGKDDAFAPVYFPDWIVTNPPYTRELVDEIVWHQIRRLENKEVLHGVAVLVRNNWDFAKKRYELFTHDYYAGQVHMMFRPWWSKEQKAEPIHNFVWHIWKVSEFKRTPEVWYWKENK